MRRELIGESFSPWTKKARWAMEHCGLDYRYREYTPTLSEPGLRLSLRQWRGSLSVPILMCSRDVIRGSWEIAQHANKVSGDERLGDFQKISEWDALSENALAQGRTNVVRRILDSDRALEQSLPGFVPAGLRGPLRFVARDAVRRLDRKYAHLAQSDALRRALLRTREGLEIAGSDFLLGNFSYADITMAVILEVIAPIARHEPPLGKAVERCWRDPELTEEFADLVAWRDRLVAAEQTTYSQFASV